MSAEAPSSFDYDALPDVVADFGRLPRLFIPGYDASHAIAAVLLAETIGESGHILAVGAGGGAELCHFARLQPGWRFTAVDPATAMLERAKERLTAMGAGDRLATLVGVSTNAPVGPFDAAIAFLALHFVPDDGSRLAQLVAIRQRLKPGAPFLIINGATDMRDHSFARDLARYAAHAANGGADPGFIADARQVQRKTLHYLPPEREVALLAEAGFGIVEQFYQALWFHGWMARAT
jgi:tRNA (cmo5U34)-methyltransferase